MLEQELAEGPAARGWPDQTWSLERIKTLIGRRFGTVMLANGVGGSLS
nr:hypothetical protein [Streptomyces sp. NTH33]